MRKPTRQEIGLAFLLLTIGAAGLSMAHAQSDLDGDARNRQVCFSATNSLRCNPDVLTATDRQKFEQAKYGDNLRSCLRGLYPALCDHDLLSPADKAVVASAEAAARAVLP